MGTFRIAIVSPFYYPVAGGITTFVGNYAQALRKERGVECRLFSRDGTSDAVATCLPLPKVLFSIFLLPYLLVWRPRVVHAHAAWYALLPAVLFKIIRPQSTLVYSFQTDPIDPWPPRSRAIMERMLAFCDLVTYDCQYFLERMQSFLTIRTRQEVLFPIVSLDPLEPASGPEFRRQLGIDEDAPVILYIGAMAWPKKVEGTYALLEALKEVLSENPSVKLILVGDGPLRPEVEEGVSKRGLGRAVFLAGKLRDVRPALQAADVYIHASLQDTLPMALLEAMAAGLPVIGFRIGGIPEVIEDRRTGFLVDPSPKAVAELLTPLLQDPMQRRRIGEAALETTRNRFSGPARVREYLRLLGANLSEPKSSDVPQGKL